MLRNVLILSQSGVVLYSKEFLNAVAQPRMTGSLVATLCEFSIGCTGNVPAYIEYENVSIALTLDERTKTICTVIQDQTDGFETGTLLSTGILRSFLAVYRTTLQDDHAKLNLRPFSNFHERFAGAVRGSLRSVLAKLNQEEGIRNAVFIAADLEVFAAAEIDRLSVVANLNALTNSAALVMNPVHGDAPFKITLEDTATMVVVVKAGPGQLIVSCNKNVRHAVCMQSIQQALHVITQVESIYANVR